jgi:hypothetical protein
MHMSATFRCERAIQPTGVFLKHAMRLRGDKTFRWDPKDQIWFLYTQSTHRGRQRYVKSLSINSLPASSSAYIPKSATPHEQTP